MLYCVDAMISADSNRNAKRMNVVLVFGLAGIATAWGAWKILEGLASAAHAGLDARGPGLLLLSGPLLLLGFVAALAFCKGIGWLPVRRSAWRILVAAMLVVSNSLCGLISEFFAVLGASFLMDGLFGNQLFRDHPIAAFLPEMFGLMIAVFASVFVLSLALYVLASNWLMEGWVALMVCGVGAVVVSLVVARTIPGIFVWRVGLDAARSGRFFQVLILLTHTLYSACAGYWLAETPRTCAATAS